MPATQTEELLRHLRTGQLDAASLAHLEQLKADDLLADLAPRYPLRFQERRLGRKWEVSLARSLRFELRAGFVHGAPIPTWVLIPGLRHCLILSGEADAITGISLSPRLIVRPIQKPFPGLALTTSRGVKLDKLPDGWEVKPLDRKTVKLTEDFLRQRGWRFDVFRQVAPHP